MRSSRSRRSRRSRATAVAPATRWRTSSRAIRPPTPPERRARGSPSSGAEGRGVKRAVVLVSGGLDSATVLAMAAADGWRCHALSVDYGQRHRAELAAAARIASALGAAEHRIVHVDLGVFGGS